MLDLNLLRKNPQRIIDRLKFRGFDFDINAFDKLENHRRSIQTYTENLQAIKNSLAKEIGFLKSKNQDCSALLKKSKDINLKIRDVENELSSVLSNLNNLLLSVPNIPHESVIFGLNNEENIEIKKWIPEGFTSNFVLQKSKFAPKDHIDLGKKMGLDLDISSKLSGSRFSFMKGNIAKLYRSLSQFMLDLHTKEHGYTECYTPFIVNESALFGTGQMPKFQDDMFTVYKGIYNKKDFSETEKQYLISTSEITLINSIRDSVISLKDLPLKLVSCTPCFRSEAGSGGKDTRGIMRQHQFDKVELVQISSSDKSYICMDSILEHAEKVLQLLSIPYRVVLLCSGDMGFSAAKTYDIEAWIPSQNTWREISSISNCESFQARRMQSKYRNHNGKLEYVHTLNGSGLAIGRTLIAILENYQQENGDVLIPEALQKYINHCM